MILKRITCCQWWDIKNTNFFTPAQERMSQINKIVRELWRSTYKGNDIDYIEIKTDDLESAGGADKRKVVNYRVVMVRY